MTDDRAALQIPASVDQLQVVRDFIEEQANAAGAGPDTVYELVLAVDEIVTNAIVHGYRCQNGLIAIEVCCTQGALEVCIRDRAPLFDPTTVPPPDLTVPAEERPIGGLGIHLARSFADAMIYRVTPEGYNELKLVKWMKR